MEDKKELLTQLINHSIKMVAASKSVMIPDDFIVLLERPKRDGQGDWATNAAMQLAKNFRLSPVDLAKEIVAHLSNADQISSVEVAPPGFMNFTLTNNWIAEMLDSVLTSGGNYGRNNSGKNRRVQIEFVSANPTGPIHLGHGRGAAVGDIMSSIMSFSGWEVEREYYINDAGLQMEMLGKSTQSRYFALLDKADKAPFPEDGYPGDYIENIAKDMLNKYGEELSEKPLDKTVELFRDETSNAVLKLIQKDLSDFGVNFDVWFSERSLYDNDLIPRTIALLKSRNYAYDKEDAVWFKSTEFGDDKDRVMIRTNGMPTYFTSDVAYLQNKYERKFDLLIYIWGADHHGYVPRVKSVNKALGASDESLEFMLIQFVSLLRNGVPVSMSKRAGTFVTLREVMDEVGKDATRFFFVSRKSDSHLEFDLELAKKTSSDNPVYYVQYAHARISSILREAEARDIKLPRVTDINSKSLSEPSEIRLAKEISRFPEEVLKAAENFEPHRVAFYATSLSEAFHAFYNNNKVLGEAKDIMESRLILVEATRITIANCLNLLGITAPERM